MSTYLPANIVRIALVAACVICTLFFPWWTVLVIMILLAFHAVPWEVLIVGLMLDLLWLPSTSFFHPLPLFTLFSIALVWVLEPLRRQLLIF